MCLAVPGRVVDVHQDRGTAMGTVDFDGIRREICMIYLPDVDVGEYVIVHVGFAISKIDEVTALETLATFRELGVLESELGDGDDDSRRRHVETPGGGNEPSYGE